VVFISSLLIINSLILLPDQFVGKIMFNFAWLCLAVVLLSEYFASMYLVFPTDHLISIYY